MTNQNTTDPITRAAHSDLDAARGWFTGLAFQAGRALMQIEEGDSLNAAAVLMVRRNDFEKVIALQGELLRLIGECERLEAKLSRKGKGGPKTIGEWKLTNAEIQRRKRARAKARAAGLPDPFAKEADSTDS